MVIAGLYDDFLLWYNSCMDAKQREMVEKLMIYGRPEILKDFRAVLTAIGIDVLANDFLKGKVPRIIDDCVLASPDWTSKNKRAF